MHAAWRSCATATTPLPFVPRIPAINGTKPEIRIDPLGTQVRKKKDCSNQAGCKILFLIYIATSKVYPALEIPGSFFY
jgi:hypothetical protein